MEPVRSVQHKGHEIRLFVSFAPDKTYVGMYELYPRDKLAQRAVVAGNFRTAQAAEDAALKSAVRWVDESTTDGTGNRK